MKTLECAQCGNTIKQDDWGIKFFDLYFCSQECLDECVSCNTLTIPYVDFEEDDDEIVNDYDIQMGYAND